MLGWELPPHNSGGLGVACYQLCKALSKKGADIEFILPYTAEHNIDFMKINAAHPQDVASVMKSGIAYDSFKYVKNTGEVQWIDLFGQSSIYEEAVGRIVQLAAFDVIHAHDWLTCRAAVRAKMLTGKPLVVHFHSIESDRSGQPGGGNPMVREVESLAMLIADKIIAVSQHTKDAIVREYNVPADKIEVVHNYSDPSDLMPEEGTESAYKYLAVMKKQGYKVITNVGRLTIQKGLPNLLRAMQLVVQREPKTFLLVVGSGEQRNELISQAADLGIARNVIFAGFQRGKNWRDAYTIADLFVMPSVSEPFGLTALEAIGYGTPVLISKQSGVSEMLKNALKVDFWDINDMADKMVAIVQNNALRDELHANAFREYNNHSWNESADKLLGLYGKHLAGAAA
ncbi:MAG TPA: glycosyltransferase family 4 protein [Candidatus Saccharimonadales bacterium]